MVLNPKDGFLVAGCVSFVDETIITRYRVISRRNNTQFYNAIVSIFLCIL